MARYEEASGTLARLNPVYIPGDEIPPGDETARLHRWGYRRYREMFNDRQLLGLELSCRVIAGQADEKIRNALATNLSDLLRYQNMLCRYDPMALKSLDIFSVHGFPVGLIQCESNLLGIPDGRKGSNVGSGGWSNIISKYERAKAYCENPFEIRHQGGRKKIVPVKGEWIGEKRFVSNMPEEKSVELYCCSSTFSGLPPASLDAVMTDPPYFANVQYAELMDFCYVWLRRLAGDNSGVFDKSSTRDENELTGNIIMERGLSHFTEGLAAVFKKMAAALKQGAPLVFTFHHNTIEAYLPVAVAILDAGLTCSASIPCSAEMGASIHINGTGSSVIDTVFVCRSTGSVSRHIIVSRPFAGHRDSVSELVGDSLESAIEDVLTRAGISYRKTKRAERIAGFDQSPDFIIPSEFNPQVVIEMNLEHRLRLLYCHFIYAILETFGGQSYTVNAVDHGFGGFCLEGTIILVFLSLF